MMIGRVVVLPEYRRQGIGTMVVSECEVWAAEMGYSKAVDENGNLLILYHGGSGRTVSSSAASCSPWQ